jgi:hypothetical protein
MFAFVRDGFAAARCLAAAAVTPSPRAEQQTPPESSEEAKATEVAIWQAMVSIKQMYHAQRRAESTPSPPAEQQVEIPTEATYDEAFLDDPYFKRVMDGWMDAIARVSKAF